MSLVCAVAIIHLRRPSIRPAKIVDYRDVSNVGIVRRLPTLRRDSGYFTYIITTSRVTSGELLKQRNGLGAFALDLRLIRASYLWPAPGATLV